MKNAVIVTVDAKGDLHLDLSGYEGGACEAENARITKLLEEMGIEVDRELLKSKLADSPRHVELKLPHGNRRRNQL